MNSDTLESSAAATRPHLRDIALAAVASLVEESGETAGLPEIKFLLLHRQLFPESVLWSDACANVLVTPSPEDARLLDLADELQLAPIEILTIALASAVEDDPIVGRALARVQSPIGGPRPTFGLIATAFGPALAPEESAYATLLNGPAFHSGLLISQNDNAPLPERSVQIIPALYLALKGHDTAWQGIQISVKPSSAVSLPNSIISEAVGRARVLAHDATGALLIRAGSRNEARAAADLIARALDRRPAFIESEKLTGVGPWLTLRGLVPVFVCDPAPSERRILPPLPGYFGPVVALAGCDGSVETADGAMPVWTLPVPPASERLALWRAALGETSAPLADTLARFHRQGAGRIAHLARTAQHHRLLRANCEQNEEFCAKDITAAAWTTEGGGLGSLAEPLTAPVEDDALVTNEKLRASLDLLLLRCRNRDELASGLGPAATTRYRAGVKSLFVGPSGSGKTLAASWLATKLGIPIFRVDLASVNSKYIGETEKNLAQLLARAEESEIILLFDEADSLFGKRTDIQESTDRFANAQTNYLLQRIETYEGIVLLTSNSKTRFDPAFARRLDCVLEFPLPSPDERRALWRAHLGAHHALAPVELNQLAALADVSGGHIRNAVLTAALLAGRNQSPIAMCHCIQALEPEFRKLNRQLPSGLALGP